MSSDELKRMDRVCARIIEDAGNTISGLSLDQIGLDEHVEANRLWRIASYLRNRHADADVEETG